MNFSSIALDAASRRDVSALAAAVLARIAERVWKLPPRRNPVRVTRSVGVPMSDGVTLVADHYLPQVSGPAPTILVRTPYGRGAPYSALYGQLYAERGFHVVMQSCRGTFGSGGTFDPMRREAGDGQDTVAWLRTQHWFDGRLITLGMSYLGFAHWALAVDPPPELIASVVHMAPHDFSKAAFRNGVFDWSNFLGWSEMVAHQHDAGPLGSIVRTATANRRLREPLNSFPLSEGAATLLGDGAPWFDGWLKHPSLDDPFWADMQHGDGLQRLSVPTLLVGGWHDLFLEQTLEQYAALRQRGVPVRLLVGSWTHVDLMYRGGPAVAESLAWLQRCVQGVAPSDNPVRVNVEGNGPWQELTDWPPPQSRNELWHLGGDHSIAPTPTGDGQPVTFRYDPHDPTPTAGGAIISPNAGPRDNRAVENRHDVAVFTSTPLAKPLDVIGEVTAQISLTRDNPNADLFVRVCDVDPDGRSINVCDGIIRLNNEHPLTDTVKVSLNGTAHHFAAGHRVRVQIAGGAHPRFARNPGTGTIDSALTDMQPTSYAIAVGGDSNSTICLPVWHNGNR
ncbi:CocE/NonD family hydrolase [Mycolicibacterium fortuitum]|uniref:CocE/NonD family hydrolase n=1 Tax=Mycolicibacterium fortuitum TaxID=1766 RepID=UPI0010556313|nr:CocE/NonD family hydrolase [Mycolicibacterium fortuitum]